MIFFVPVSIESPSFRSRARYRPGHRLERMEAFLAVAIPLVALGVGVWCGIRIERHRRDREHDQLLDDR